MRGFFLGRFRAARLAGSGRRRAMLHSLPTYHGLLRRRGRPRADAGGLRDRRTAASAGSPTRRPFPQFARRSAADELQRGVVLRDVHEPGCGAVLGHALAELREAADSYACDTRLGQLDRLRRRASRSACWRCLFSLGAHQPRRFAPATSFERFVLVVLALCATVAILTTIGIVFSVLVRDLPVLLRSRAQRAARRSPSSCSAPSGTRRRRCAPTRATSRRRSASSRC